MSRWFYRVDISVPEQFFHHGSISVPWYSHTNCNPPHRFQVQSRLARLQVYLLCTQSLWLTCSATTMLIVKQTGMGTPIVLALTVEGRAQWIQSLQRPSLGAVQRLFCGFHTILMALHIIFRNVFWASGNSGQAWAWAMPLGLHRSPATGPGASCQSCSLFQ